MVAHGQILAQRLQLPLLQPAHPVDQQHCFSKQSWITIYGQHGRMSECRLHPILVPVLPTQQ